MDRPQYPTQDRIMQDYSKVSAMYMTIYIYDLSSHLTKYKAMLISCSLLRVHFVSSFSILLLLMLLSHYHFIIMACSFISQLVIDVQEFFCSIFHFYANPKSTIVWVSPSNFFPAVLCKDLGKYVPPASSLSVIF